MASSSFALRLSSVHKTPNSTKPDDPSTSLSSVFKPLLKDLRHAPLILNVSRAVNDTYRRMLDTFVDSVFLFVDQPYLQSQRNFAPIKEIGHAVVLGNIEGKIPTTFPPGVYIRNGPNPLFGGLKSAVSLFGKSSSIWIEGEGMLHALYFTKDTDQDHWTVSYNNKYVVTDTFKQEKKQNKPSFLPALYGDSQAIIAAILINVWRFGKAYKCSSNTSVFEHSGKLYSITESHMPHGIDLATLETNVGEWDVEKSWGRPFTSHPKKAPGTGELVIIGAGAFKPFIELGVISADGEKLLHKVDLKFNRSIICHEIGVTQKYNIIIDIPLIVDIKRLVKGGPLIKFEKEKYAAIGVMPRYGDGNSIRWFEVVPHCTVHIFNCFEDGNEVVVRGSRARGSKIPGPDFGRDEVEWFSRGIVPVVQFQEDADNNLEVGELFSCPYEWRLNMETGEVKEKSLTRSSLSMDFPLINEKYTGVKNNYGYTQVVDLTASSISGRAKHGMLAKLYFQEPEAIPSKPLVKEMLHISMELNVSRTIKHTSSRMLDSIVDSVFEFVDQPYLPSQSNFAPVEEIEHVVRIENIEGKIPTDFPIGAYMRIGPNPLFGGFKSAISLFGKSSHVWIEGEGMLHALYFSKDSHDSWTVFYNNRYVETETLIREKRKNKPSFLPALEGNSSAVMAAYLLNFLRFGTVNKCLSNTNIFEHSGKLYTIAENHLPQEIDINTLQATGIDWDVGGRWGRPFTSHPKKAPGTGELVVVGVDAVKPFFVLGVVSADGKKLLHKVDLKFKRSTLCHEIGVTQNYNIIMDCPLTIDINRLVNGQPLMKYDKESYAKIGVMPRYGDADSVRWFEVATHCTFHILNCFEDDDEVVVRGCRALGSAIPGPDFGHDKFEWFSRGFKPIDIHKANSNFNMEDGQLFSRTYEWRLNMETGEVKEKNLTGTSFSMEFPMINENYVGQRNKYGYTMVVDSVASSSSGMAKYGMLAKLHLEDMETRLSEEHIEFEEPIKVEYHKFEENNFCSGAAFVSNHRDNGEDSGWIVSFVHNEENGTSQVHIIDAKNFEAEAVAKITLPKRVPYGFHGAYFPATIQQEDLRR